MQTLGQRLRESREKRGISVYRLSKMTGIAETTIYRIETDEATPKIDTIWEFAKQLNVDPKWLSFGGNVDPWNRFFMHRDFAVWLTANRLSDGGTGFEARVTGFGWTSVKRFPAGAIPGIEPKTNNPATIGTWGWQSFGSTADEVLDLLQARIVTALDEAYSSGDRPLDSEHWRER